MDSVFEIRFVCNHTMLSEFYRKYGTGPRPPAVILCALIYLFFVMRSILWGIFEEMIPTLLFMGIIFALLYFLPDWFTWNILRHTKKQNDGILPETIASFGDHIEVDEGMVHYTIEYRKLMKVVSLKHSYVLMLGKRNGIILDASAFTKGTFEEFKQFLREKRPDLSIPE